MKKKITTHHPCKFEVFSVNKSEASNTVQTNLDLAFAAAPGFLAVGLGGLWNILHQQKWITILIRLVYHYFVCELQIQHWCMIP